MSGLRWWSYWRPDWEVAVVWSAGVEPPWFDNLAVVEVESLAIGHPAVRRAADVLPRELR